MILACFQAEQCQLFFKEVVKMTEIIREPMDDIKVPWGIAIAKLLGLFVFNVVILVVFAALLQV